MPKFRIVSPAGGSNQRGGRAEVKIDVEAVPDPIKVIRVQVNGRQVDEITPEVGAGGFTAGLRTLDVPLGKGRNEIRITLSNDIGDKAETVTLNHEGDGDLDKRGTLYILAIGVDQYPRLGKPAAPPAAAPATSSTQAPTPASGWRRPSGGWGRRTARWSSAC